MTSYQFRAVDLSLLGVAMGYNERGERVRVIVPCASGNRQLANVSVSVEVHANSAWSAGVMSLRQMNHINAEPVDFGTPVTIGSSDKLKGLASTEADAAFVAIVTTTANSGAALVDLNINVTDNV
jgi:hypothetical protein